MIELLDDMPEGTLGFRATGRVTRDDYRDVLLPPDEGRGGSRRGPDGVCSSPAWLVPGELMIRDLDGLEEAKAWVGSDP